MGGMYVVRVAFLPPLTYYALSQPTVITAQESAPPHGHRI
jgi:hypothetical protein